MQFSKEELLDLATQSGGRFGCNNLDEAYRICRSFCVSHYENFPVASLLLPKKIRKHVFAIYSFSRIADDIADELVEEVKVDRISALNEMIRLLDIDYNSIDYKDKKNPIFFAVNDTICNFSIPKSLFQRLINAFKRDVLFTQPENLDDVLSYCNNSANPIGELVLRLYKITNQQVISYSNSICTALQLINFWQDISIDKIKNRIYIPKDFIEKYNFDNTSLFIGNSFVSKKKLLNELYDITQLILNKGKPIVNELKPLRLKLEIKATILSGERILKKIRKIGEKVLYLKIKLSIIDIIIVAIKTLTIKVK